MWDPNSDGKWGPSYHDIEQFFSYGYYGDYGYHYTTNIDDQITYNASHYQENQYPNVNNESLVSLQHGLSGLSIADGNQSSNEVAEHLQASNYPVEEYQTSTVNQDLYRSPSLNHYNCNELVETKKIGKSTPCSIPRNQSCDGEDNSFCLDIIDEPEVDGEVNKKLDKITPVAHTPKINGNIPSIIEASSDHQRLLHRMELYRFVESKVLGDGNCQFRALSEQLYYTSDHHKSVRERVVMQLKMHPKMYEDYVPMAYTDYLRQISQKGEWGDHVTLQAAADSYGVKILVLTSFRDTIFIEILPKVLTSRKVVFLSYWAEVHYNSMYPEKELDLPPSVIDKKKKKKKWWNFKKMPTCISIANMKV